MQTIKKIRTQYNEIWIGDDGILRLKPDEGAELNLEEVVSCFDVYRELGCDKTRVLQIIYAHDTMTISPEGRDYASKHGFNFFNASAVINDSLAIRLIVNFFNVFYKQPVPFKMFAREEDALEWLNSFR